MNLRIKKTHKNRIIGLLAILSMVFLIFSSNIGNFANSPINVESNEDNITEDTLQNVGKNEPTIVNQLQSSAIGEDFWWNSSFRWRQVINVTNPFSNDLINATASIKLNLTEYAGKIQNDLDDIRVVENNILRDYYCTKDYYENMTTIWFETNISAHNSEYDTYLYYGNDSVSKEPNHFKEDKFGIAWYSFDEDTIAGKIKDSMGKHNATLNGLGTTVNYVSSKYDQGLDFDDSQTTAYIDVPVAVLNGLRAFAICFWGTAGPTPNDEYIISGATTSTDNYMIFHAPQISGWHFYVWQRYSNGTTRAYVDLTVNNGYIHTNPGSPISLPTGGLIIAQEQDSVGDNFVASQAFSGMLDDVRVFNHGLSSQELNWLYNNYELQTELIFERERTANLKIIARDVDGRQVPGAIISLVKHNFTTGITEINKIDITSDAGFVTFGGIEYNSVYNITAEYELNPGYVVTVYNSTKQNYGTPQDEIYTFEGLSYTVEITVNLTTIDFEIVDNEENPLYFAYANITKGEDPDGPVIKTISLGNGGKGTFRWLNRSDGFYYKIYFNNSDYTDNEFLLNEGPLNRADYLNVKEQSQTIWVNNTNINEPDQDQYQIQQRIYTNGTLVKFSNKKVINATISLKNMNDNITRVIIQYIDASNISGSSNKIFDQSYTEEITDLTLNFDMCTLENQNLINDAFDVHGLFIWVFGENDTTAKGIIEVNLTETWNLYNISAVSKMRIQILDNTEHLPLGGVVIHINQTDSRGNNYAFPSALVNLTTVYSEDSLGRDAGYAYGKKNKLVEFWYRIGYNYNFTLQYLGQNNRAFDVVYTNPTSSWEPELTQIYNYTLTQESTLIFYFHETLENYYTNFTENKERNTDCTWGEEIYFEVNFSATTNGGISWRPILDSTDVKCSIYSSGFQGERLIQETLLHQGEGNYTISINSNRLSAGFNSKSYLALITATQGLYSPPDSLSFSLTVNAKPTSISVYDYPSLAVKSSNNVSQYYDELVNITVKYQEVGQSTGLTSAELTYDWQFGSGQMVADPLHADYFIYELDTSLVGNTGSYLLSVTGQYENCSEKAISIGIDVLTRPTKINGTTRSLHNSTSIWVGNDFIFYYAFKDSLSGARITNADEAYYYWSELDAKGVPIELSKNINLKLYKNVYKLDFNASGKEVGEYSIYLVFEKNNYEARAAIINFEIKKRVFSTSLSLNNGTGTTVSVVKGQPVVISLTLTDLTRGGASSSSLGTQATVPLSGATVTLYITELAMSFTLTEKEKTGVYTLTIDTSDPIYQAFFTPQTLTGNFTVEKHNYETQTIPFTLVVGMTEILPGFPTFYFILLVVGIGAVVGSLATYRYIQVAKIPKFVKDVRKMKKNIKAEENIPEALAYPSKKEMMAELMGDKWKAIGLSLEQILGIESKKGKTLPDLKEDKLEGGAI